LTRRPAPPLIRPTKRVSENEVELSLLGSYNREAERMTVDLLLRAWEAGHDAGALSNSSTEPSEDKVRVRRRSAGLAEIKSYVSGPRPTASEPHCSASALKRLSGR